MSILIYHDGTLIADHRGYVETEGLDFWTDMNKIFKSVNNDAYLGVVGREVLKDHQDIIDLMILVIHDKATAEQRQKLLDEVSGRSFVLMTKDEAHSYGSLHRNVELLKDSRYSCFGDGQVSIMTSLHMGLSVKEAIEISHRSSYGTPRGTELNVTLVSSSALLPINLNNYFKEPSNEPL